MNKVSELQKWVKAKFLNKAEQGEWIKKGAREQRQQKSRTSFKKWILI